MKKTATFRAIVMGLAMLTGSLNASAQFDLSSIIGGLTGTSSKSSSSSSSSTSDIVSSIVSVFTGNKQANANSIVGTWEYSEPAIVFESSNLLSSAGTSIISGKIEDKLSEQLTKFGFTAGAFSITFNEDGTFTSKMKSRTSSGKWEIEDSKLKLTYTLRTVTITTQLSGSKLMFVTDATKLLDLFKTLGSQSSSSSLSTLSSLMSGVEGMKVGLTLVRK